MSDGIYVGMCGAVARAEQLEAVADNLANAQTPGFKSARPAFEAFLPASGAPDKAYPAAVSTGFDLRAGPPSRTGNALDVLPEGNAFLAVKTSTGSVAYTRDGRMSIDSDHRLVIQGRPVLGRDGQPIVLPSETTAEIDPDGSVRAGGSVVGEIARVQIDGQVNRIGPALLEPTASTKVSPSEAKLRVGELELGNAPPLESAIDMISAQRHFETSMQAIQTYRQLDQRATDVGRLR